MRYTLLAAAVLATAASAQIDLSEANNVTSLQGTWSTGSGAVSTGGVSLFARVCVGPLVCGLGIHALGS